MISSSSDLGKAEKFCSPRGGGITFNFTGKSQFAITDDYNLKDGDSLQFEVTYYVTKSRV